MAPMDSTLTHGERPPPALEYSDGSISGVESQDEHDKSIAKGGVTTPFPWKLHGMLDEMDRQCNHTMVCWQPHGRAFMVHKPKEFVDEIMSHYFNQTKYASFQRQLNLYGFSRLSHGKDKGAYYHKCFVRGERALCRGMVRQKIKGTKVRRSLSPEEEPNFYLAQWSKSKPVSRPSPQLKKQVYAPRPLPHPARPLPSPVTSKQGKTDPPLTTSLVLMMKETKRSTIPAILPPPPVIKPLNPPISHAAPHAHPPKHSTLPPPNTRRSGYPPNSSVKGGDLLFFEGLPFRYLEHIEELPPAPQPPRNQNYKGTLHAMISSIVSMDASWTEKSRNVCSV
jgi:hypothetical protein